MSGPSKGLCERIVDGLLGSDDQVQGVVVLTGDGLAVASEADFEVTLTAELSVVAGGHDLAGDGACAVVISGLVSGRHSACGSGQQAARVGRSQSDGVAGAGVAVFCDGAHDGGGFTGHTPSASPGS